MGVEFGVLGVGVGSGVQFVPAPCPNNLKASPYRGYSKCRTHAAPRKVLCS